MVVRIVTDSTSDIPDELAKELDITVIPVYLIFGDETFRDRIDMSEDEFYKRLTSDPIHPTTTQPTPKDFDDAYQKLSKEADGIISIHLTKKLSGTYQSAFQSAKSVKNCPIEVIDTYSVSMGLGLLVIEAAKMAKAGKSYQEIVAEVKKMIPDIHVFALFDTLKYLAKGGRIGKGKALLGSILSVKPMLTLKEGEFEPVGQLRNRRKGIDKLFSYLENATSLKKVAIVHSTTPDEAQALAERVSSLLSKEHIRVARLGPALGVHGGPMLMVVAFIGSRS
jgi:DegV family protein with EDD domain